MKRLSLWITSLARPLGVSVWQLFLKMNSVVRNEPLLIPTRNETMDDALWDHFGPDIN